MSYIICPKCKYQSKGNEQFCSKCGTKLESVAVFCRGCGRELNADDRFCGKCGTRVKSNLWWIIAIVLIAIIATIVSVKMNEYSAKQTETKYGGGF